jgi:hypothetical protein
VPVRILKSSPATYFIASCIAVGISNAYYPLLASQGLNSSVFAILSDRWIRVSTQVAVKEGWARHLPHATYVGLDPNFSGTAMTPE